jgi:flagellin
MRVNNNMYAQNTYRNLFNTNNRMGKSLEKLSSGLRINRAGDDAAGLGVSEKLRAQVSGLQVGIDNAQDGISVIQTAEGALDRTHAILRRVRDLSLSAANGDKTDDDRAKYQAEVDQLLDEIDRISTTTEYNTKKLLNGAMGASITEDASKLDTLAAGTAYKGLVKNVSVDGSIGAKGVYTLQFDTALDNTTDKVANTQFAAIRTSDGGLTAVAGTNWEGSDTLEQVFAMNEGGGETETLTFRQPGQGKEVAVTLSNDDTINEAVKKMQDALDANGMDIDVFWQPDSDQDGAVDEGTFQFEARKRGAEYNFFVSGQSSSAAGEKIVVNDATNGTTAADDADNDGLYQGDGTGLEALVDPAAINFQVTIFDPNGSQTQITSHSSTFKADMANNDMFKVVDNFGRDQGIAGIKFTLDIDNVNTGWAANAYRAGIDISGVMEFQVGPNQGADHRVSAAINDMGTNSLGISGLDISTQEAAQNLVDSMRVDDAIATVSETRGNLGALQNRLEHTIQNLSVSKENLASSESRIRDTDMASEMMEFTRNQIMQQAGTAMLGQANMVTQSVLQLLG